MDSSQLENTNQHSHIATDAEKTRISANRRVIWLSSFALFSVSIFVYAPGFLPAVLLALVLTTLCILDANRFTKIQQRNLLPVSAIFGPVLAAILLWLAVISGATIIQALNIAGSISTVIAASVLSLVSYGVLVFAESALTAAAVFLTSRNHDGATRFAWLLDQKYAGFFGETR